MIEGIELKSDFGISVLPLTEFRLSWLDGKSKPVPTQAHAYVPALVRRLAITALLNFRLLQSWISVL